MTGIPDAIVLIDKYEPVKVKIVTCWMARSVTEQPRINEISPSLLPSPATMLRIEVLGIIRSKFILDSSCPSVHGMLEK